MGMYRKCMEIEWRSNGKSKEKPRGNHENPMVLDVFWRSLGIFRGLLSRCAGPRMGEKIVLSEKVCTLGRGEGNTIQALCDPYFRTRIDGETSKNMEKYMENHGKHRTYHEKYHDNN